MAYSGEVLYYSSHGEEYEVPRRRVTSLKELQRGDHIAFLRYSGVLWHHAIIEGVDTELGEIYVIEYNNSLMGFLKDNINSPKNPGIAQVVRGTNRFHEVDVYLMIHERCLDRDTVVRRARCKLGDRKYNPLTNNCEHFAVWCKTGRSSSDQVNKAVEMVGKEALAQTASQTGRQLVKSGAEMTTKLAAQSTSQAGQAIVRTGLTRSLSQAGRNMAMASNVETGMGGSLAGGALTAAFEGLSVVHDIDGAQQDLVTGRFSKEEFNKTVRKRFMTGTGGITGSAAGATIGQAHISVPLVGATIGGVVGGLAGRFFGNIAGNAAFEDDNAGGGGDYNYYYADDSEDEYYGGGDYYFETGDDDDDDDYYYDEAKVYYYDDSDDDENGGFVYSYY